MVPTTYHIQSPGPESAPRSPSSRMRMADGMRIRSRRMHSAMDEEAGTVGSPQARGRVGLARHNGTS
jgi:hypothetical protein